MAKDASAGMIDGGLDKIATSVNLTVCSGQPTSFADIAVKKLATATITGADFTKANGDISGRNVTIASQASMAITATGTADHVVIDDGVSEYEITTVTAKALMTGGIVTSPAWKIEISKPA